MGAGSSMQAARLPSSSKSLSAAGRASLVLGHCTDTEKPVSYIVLFNKPAPVVSRSQVQNTKCAKVFFFPGSSRPWLCCASHWAWLWWLSTAASCPKLCWRWTSTNSRYVIYKKLQASMVKPRDSRIGSNKLSPYLCYL